METKKLFLSATLVLGLAACGKPQATQTNGEFSTGIVGGAEVESGDEVESSTVGLVVTMAEGQGVCSGTLIAENLVVTAAHCLDGLRSGFVVFSRDMNSGAQPVSRKIEKSIVNPKYEPKDPGQGGWSDIGVLRFAGKGLPAGYKPAPFLKDPSKLVKEMPVIFAGYGITSPMGAYSSTDDSGVLRKVDTTLADAKYEGNELLFAKKASGASTCQGDSGGPAYATIDNHLTLIGVTSRGEDEKCNGISISTNVAEHAAFVEQSMKTLNFNKQAARR